MSLEYPLAKAALFARLKEDKAVCKMDFEIRDDFPPTRFWEPSHTRTVELLQRAFLKNLTQN